MTEQKTDIEKLLDGLRWGPDMVITNYDGERVWLTERFDENGKRIGITDCCPESEPCDYHRAIAGAVRLEPEQ